MVSDCSNTFYNEISHPQRYLEVYLLFSKGRSSTEKSQRIPFNETLLISSFGKSFDTIPKQNSY